MTPGDIVNYTGLVRRFWIMVRIDDEGCWEWQGARLPAGYGMLSGKLRTGKWRPLRANRLSYIIHHGSVPDDLHVLHACDNPGCVRPDHLFLGTDRDNILDSWKKGRRVSRPMYGEHAPNHRLTWPDVEEIRAAAATGATRRELAARFDVTTEQIGNIVRCRQWVRIPS